MRELGGTEADYYNEDGEEEVEEGTVP